MNETLLEMRLTSMEAKIEKLVALVHKKQSIAADDAWLPEATACEMLSRKKQWLKKQRLGYTAKTGQRIPPTLRKDKDWISLNGRTPQYNPSAILNLKRKLQNLQP